MQEETKPASTEVIDWDACVRLCSGNPDLARELLSLLDKDLRSVKETLAKAYQEKNTEALRAELHRIRGGVSYLKVPQLERALKTFHEAVKAEPQRPEQLEETYSAVQEAVETFWKAWEKQSLKSCLSRTKV